MSRRGANTPGNAPKGGLRPPWKPGQSGNPKGRPKGQRNKATLAAEALLDGEAETITRACIDAAKAGDATAMRLAMERILPPRKGRRITFELKDLNGAGAVCGAVLELLKAVSHGDLSPEEAAAVGPLIEAARKALETDELARRVEALEQSLDSRGGRS